MHKAQNLGDPIRRHPVNNQVPRFTDPKRVRQQVPNRPKMQRSHARDTGNFSRAWGQGRIPDQVHGGHDKAGVPISRFQPPAGRAFEQGCVDPILGMPDEAVRHLVLVGGKPVSQA